ncbi:sulfur carrier protein ThiS [Desulfohalotomaculum tongense]|uniref:MoaD/ThiS family protein n=1 Tax=Desulforadius tongensis TaxID=1216062 RepID=UPI00195D2327|nr:MoaD/ThiS family protein [Desulforadius tongensis]MBM7853980.1 sulfur carrier protein ThiS [Desulforadius tongensis]
MLLEVRLYSGLEKYVENAQYGKPIQVELPEGATVKQLLDKLGIPQEQVFSVLVNGTHYNCSDVMEDGDRVALFPPVGGG